jgi:hypothetical protein
MSNAWSLERIEQIRGEIASGARTERKNPEPPHPYHRRAAVVISFKVEDWMTDTAATRRLIEDSTLLDEADGVQRWMLKNEVRKRVLEYLSDRSRIADELRSTTDRPQDVLQKVFDALIEKRSIPLDEQSQEELSATLQLIDWFSGTKLARELPEREAVRRRVQLAAMTETFRVLVGDHFRGRARELAVLRDYVGALPPYAKVDDLWRKPPLLIQGPGGMGKSTLVAEFILRVMKLGPERLPVVYLDCDCPTVVVEEPFTLLIEAVRQLGLQFPEQLGTAERLSRKWLSSLAATHASQRKGPYTRDLKSAMEEMQFFVGDLNVGERPLLFVIDTFEEIQFRSRDYVREVFAFLEQLQKLMPLARIVIAGRNPLPRDEFPHEPLPLGALDFEAAQGYLAARGVTDSRLQATLARQLHGNPLSLKLAATIVAKEAIGEGGIDDIKALKDDTEIQGVLYRRILGHVHEEDVRQLAHPGLILRRIDWRIIRHVLAEPCGVAVKSDDDAKKLFGKLRQELALVTPEGDAVVHRPDVRRVMLEPLRRDQADKVYRIQRAAIDYYKGFDDVVSRAEEVYQRLLLGEPPAEVETRWRPEIGDLLRNAIDELPRESRAYLASKLDIELIDEDWETIDPLTWEGYAVRRVTDLLRLDRAEEALRILAQRSYRSDSSDLYLLEAQALQQTGRLREAREVVRAGAVAWQRHAHANAKPPVRSALESLLADLDRQIEGAPAPSAEQAPEGAPMQTQIAQSYQIDEAASVGEELTEALAEALPSMTDLAIIGRLFGLDPATLESPSQDEMLGHVIASAGSQGRLGELVNAAAKHNAEAPKLRAYLAKDAKSIRTSSDPFDAVWLSQGTVFIGRPVLRQFLRQLSKRPPESRVLFVTGAAGTGKSYTVTFCEHIAQATNRFVLTHLELNEHWSCDDLIGAIYSRNDWRWDRRRGREKEAATRRERLDLDQLFGHARRDDRIRLIVADCDPPLNHEVSSFLRALATGLDRGRDVPIGLIFVDFPAGDVPLAHAIFEELQALDKDEVIDGLSNIVTQNSRQIGRDVLSNLGTDLVERARDLGASANRTIAQGVNSILRKLL